MKVILLAPLPPPTGGIATWTNRMINEHLKNGWKCVVVNEHLKGKRGLFGNNSKRHFVDEIGRTFHIWCELRKALKDDEVKVVHSCIPATTFAMLRELGCAIITKLYKRKFITHFRCTVPNMRDGRFWETALKFLCNASDVIISLNNQATECMKKYTKTPIVLIPNYISKDEIADKDRQINESIKTVLYVGGGIRTKGCMEVIETAKEFPDIEFRFCGDCSDEVTNYPKTVNTSNITFCGMKNREELRQELNNADVFIFLTYFPGEGFSNALTEAMGAGLPCLVSDWAANKDMIGDDGGCVVPVRDSAAAVKALQSMLPKAVREKQSHHNLIKVKSDYSAEAVLNQYVDLYEQVIKK